MSQWQPQQYDPRQHQQRIGFPPPNQQQVFAPPPAYPPPSPYPYAQQRPYAAVTKRGLGPFWTLFHLFMTCMTLGMWIPIWIWHKKSRNTVTRYR